MPAYEPNTKKNVMITLELPSTEGKCWIKVPSRLGFGTKSDVQSQSMTTRIIEPTEEQIKEAEARGEEAAPEYKLFFDPMKAARLLLVYSCLDSRAFTNITDENDKPITLTRHWVENVMDEDDALYCSQMLLTGMWEQIGAPAPEGEPKEGDSPLASTAAPKETSESAGRRTRNTKS